MKTSLTQQEIKITFCTVSSSLLLCSSMEVQASPVEEDMSPWYRQDVPMLSMPAQASTYPGRFST
ncbi:autotransporter outer membrane beta-barrel domain-containing protein, partial [Pseudomonas sp. MWU13-2860]